MGKLFDNFKDEALGRTLGGRKRTLGKTLGRTLGNRKRTLGNRKRTLGGRKTLGGRSEVDPVDVRVAREPGHLLLGIDAGVLFHPFDGEGELPGAIENLEHLLVADGVEGILVAIGQEGTGLFEEAVGHHLIHAAVDAGEEVGAVAAQPDLDDVEGALLVHRGAEAAEGVPRLVADLQGVEDALRVLEIDLSIVVGVEEAQLTLEGFQAFVIQALVQELAGLRLNRRDVVDTAADRIDIHHGTSAEEKCIVGFEEFFREGEDVGLVARGAVVVRDGERPHEVVFHAGELLRGGGGGADGQVAIELAAVGIENRARKVLGELEGQLCLADGRGAEEDDEGFMLH